MSGTKGFFNQVEVFWLRMAVMEEVLRNWGIETAGKWGKIDRE